VLPLGGWRSVATSRPLSGFRWKQNRLLGYERYIDQTEVKSRVANLAFEARQNLFFSGFFSVGKAWLWQKNF